MLFNQTIHDLPLVESDYARSVASEYYGLDIPVDEIFCSQISE
jgi:hypothetical protein